MTPKDPERPYFEHTDQELAEDLRWYQDQVPGCYDPMEAGKYLNQVRKIKEEIERRKLTRP